MTTAPIIRRRVLERQIRRGSWRRFVNIYRSIRIPWWLYATYIALGILAAQITLWIAPLNARILRGDFTSADLVPLFIAFTIGRIVVVLGRGLAELYAGGRVERNLQWVVWGKLIAAPTWVYDRNSAPEQVSRVTNDARGANQALTALAGVWTSLYGFIGAIIAMTAANSTLSILFVLIVPITWLLFWIVGRTEFIAQHRIMEAWGVMTGFFGERLEMARSLKTLGALVEEKRAGFSAIDSMFRAGILEALLRAVQTLSGAVVQNLVLVIVFVGGAAFIRAGEMEQPDLALFYSLSLAAMPFLFEMLGQYQAVKGSQGFTQKLGHVIELPQENTTSGVATPPEARDIILENVSFAYEEKLVLKDVTVTIPAGSVTAIVGTNGSGKTTLLRLIERIYEPTSGAIRLGEQRLSEFSLDSWRQVVSPVPQSAPVLSGTIRDNIAFSDLEMTDARVRDAAQVACADHFIDAHADGYNRQIGQSGGNLSGGQRQRVSIARALAASPWYLILDEASSALDRQTDERIDSAIKHAAQGCTVIIVSHRLSTIADADQIIVLRDGVVDAVDTHSRLLERCAVYQKLARAEARRFPS